MLAPLAANTARKGWLLQQDVRCPARGLPRLTAGMEALRKTLVSRSSPSSDGTVGRLLARAWLTRAARSTSLALPGSMDRQNRALASVYLRGVHAGRKETRQWGFVVAG